MPLILAALRKLLLLVGIRVVRKAVRAKAHTVVASRASYYRDKFKVGDCFGQSSTTVTSSDGETLAVSMLDGEGPCAFLVVHGLFAHRCAPGFRDIAVSLTRFGPVWTMDLRGHGESSGRSTLGNLEALDVAAVSGRMKAELRRPVVIVGFSMGAAASVRAASLHGVGDAVVSVSGPARWHGPRRWAAKRTALVWKVPAGIWAAERMTGVRLDPDWVESESPADVIGEIAPRPVLVVHGAADSFFPSSEADDLYAGADEPKDLWLIHRGGHAEGLVMDPGDPVEAERVDRFTDELVSRVTKLLGVR